MDLTALHGLEFDDEFRYADCYGNAKEVVFTVSRFLGNLPTIHAVTGIKSEKGIETIERKLLMLATRDALSGGGNGNRTFTLPAGDGFYYLSGIREASKRTCNALLIVNGGKVAALDVNIETVRQVLPGVAIAAAAATRLYEAEVETAKKVIQDIEAERNEFGEQVIDEVIARPEFGKLPDLDRLIVKMKSDGFDPDQYVVETAAPIHYVVTDPAFAKAATAEEAVAQAKKTIEDRERAAEEAKTKASESGLPELTGSEKQIAWAIRIRDAAMRSNPKHPSLKRATTAKYWIEHRAEFE